jgi:hypothetical protein
MSEEFLDDAAEQAAEAVGKQRKQYGLDEFVYDLKEERYWDLETLTDYSKDSINAMVPRDEWEQELLPGRNGSVRAVQIKPASSIARVERNSVVEGNTWWPGKPRIIEDIVVTDDGDVHAKGRRMLNTYQAPTHHTQGNPAMAGLWIEHIKRLWPDDAEVMMDYFAHTVQHPGEKINFGIVLLGEQGIGKDSALQPVRYAIGECNCKEISPDELFSNYNSYADCLLLVINEARPAAEDFKATNFYEKLKTLTAAPPNWIMMNGKYQKQRHVRNLMRVIITTNDPLALYVPENDRRLHFAKSHLESKWADRNYFDQLYDYYEAGGLAHVYAYLLQRDISKFSPKQKPAANAAWKSVVASWNTPVHNPLTDVIDELGWPEVFFGVEILSAEVAAFDNKDEMKVLLRSSRKLSSMMAKNGYETIQSTDKNNGWHWHANGKRFKARVAFVKVGFKGDIEAAIDARGTEIAECGKAAKSKIIKFPG